MNTDSRIYADANAAAVLKNGKIVVQFPTLTEAVTEWNKLHVEAQSAATISVGATTYSAAEIDRLHFGPEPAPPEQ